MTAIPAEMAQALAAGLVLFAIGLFSLSSLHKFRTFTEFSGFVAGYRLVPSPLVRVASTLIVFLEALAVLTLLLAPLLAPPALAYLPAALLMLYAGVMAINLLRGRPDIDCGCGGTPMPLSWTLVIRNLLLAAAIGWAMYESTGIAALLELNPGSLAAVLGFTGCLGVFYACLNQLQANRAIHRRLWVATT